MCANVCLCCAFGGLFVEFAFPIPDEFLYCYYFIIIFIYLVDFLNEMLREAVFLGRWEGEENLEGVGQEKP